MVKLSLLYFFLDFSLSLFIFYGAREDGGKYDNIASI